MTSSIWPHWVALENIRRIAHGVEQLGGGGFANDPIFKEADGAGRVGAASDEEGEHGEAHADEDDFAIVHFTRGGGHHQFAEGVGASGGFGFRAMGQVGCDLVSNDFRTIFERVMNGAGDTLLRSIYL